VSEASTDAASAPHASTASGSRSSAAGSGASGAGAASAPHASTASGSRSSAAGSGASGAGAASAPHASTASTGAASGLAASPASAPATDAASGAFERAPSVFRDWVEIDESGRYHLYVASACPWCHRTIIVRRLKRLEDAVGISFLDPIRDERGWAFSGGAYVDEIEGMSFLAEAYARTDPRYSGRISAPVLWDRRERRIVNNESSEIIRMFDASPLSGGPELYPRELRAQVDAINERVYASVNNGVYRAGFARRQHAYEAAVGELFAALDWLEELLATRRYLLGEQLTEADWRLFPTLVRFDPVYVGHFKCNLRRLIDYEALWGYTRELYQQPGIAATVAFDEIKRHYYMTHASINPTGVVPLGPILDFDAPQQRAGALAHSRRLA
jgi:glutathionyl-hydroquinone reductase